MIKTTIKFEDINKLVNEICRSISQSNWRPDYVVGITSGGLVAATLISHWFDIPCETLKVCVHDGEESETNCWMAEDAYNGKNILIINDINNTGETLNWIKNDWVTSCMPSDTNTWNSRWNTSVKFAVIVNNEASDFTEIDYSGRTINKLDNPEWIVFPWESWWR